MYSASHETKIEACPKNERYFSQEELYARKIKYAIEALIALVVPSIRKTGPKT